MSRSLQLEGPHIIHTVKEHQERLFAVCREFDGQKNSRRPRIPPLNASLPRFQAAVNWRVNLNMVFSSPDVINSIELFVRNIHIPAKSSTCGQVSAPSNPPQVFLKSEVMDLVTLKRSVRLQPPAIYTEYETTSSPNISYSSNRNNRQKKFF